MNDEERRDSLADQAAAWVPPWQRPTPPAPDAAADLGNETPPEGPQSSKIATVPAAASAAPASETPASETPASETPAPEASADLGSSVPPEGPQTSKIATDLAEGPADLGTDAPPEGPERTKIATADAGAGDRAGGRRRAGQAQPEPAPELDDAELRGALEAILLVVDEPVSELTLAEVLEQPAERVGAMLDRIAAGYTDAGYGFELRRAAGGWRLYTRPEYATYVERFVLDGQSVRLTQAALETLAVVAYKQPVTRSRISAIRGVNCDGVIRTLVSRGLVEECGTEPESGAFLYRTTTLFLEKLGLNTVDELPPLAPFLPDDVEELTDASR
ncbi:SMC-Scp complex subunit ScpB [Micromonospora sp. NPDC049366]|uniref:SMC-Scp complex subunit ScpB n=1 Tax=Micromonospora sp. NPDC049366 TaxID=3364271 RepID=UPI0037937832